jgi:hypothetical protein
LEQGIPTGSFGILGFAQAPGKLPVVFLSGKDCAPGEPCGNLIGNIDDKGDFVGAVFPGTPVEVPFIDKAGILNTLNMPSTSAEADSSNNQESVVVGDFQDSAGAFHGYVYNTANVHFTTTDFPGATGTFILGVNNAGVLSGNYTDDDSVPQHGFVRVQSHWLSYDYPGAVWTSLIHINDSNTIVGSYHDTNGIDHGLVLRVTVTP